MTAYTVQLGQAHYSFALVTVEGDTLDDALGRAIRTVSQDGIWQMSRIRGPVFVNEIALGANTDLVSAARLDIPPSFIEIPPPRVIVTMARGVVQDIAIAGGTVTIEVRESEVP